MRPYLVFSIAAIAVAQVPTIGDFDLYGLRKVPEAAVRKAAGAAVGDPLPGSKGDIEDRLEQLSGVAAARVEAVCCEQGKVSLFIGIEERGGAHFAVRSAPSGNAVLPPEILAETDPAAMQKKFREFAAANLALVRDVLRNAADEEQRGVAALVIGYAPDKKKVLDELLYALQDPDDLVRANAMRSLEPIVADPNAKVPATWFVEMLNSVVLSDRRRASEALVTLTERANSAGAALAQIRERALPAVLEMARWENLRYALPPFLLAGRLAGLSEQHIQDAWKSGDREKVLSKLR